MKSKWYLLILIWCAYFVQGGILLQMDKKERMVQAMDVPSYFLVEGEVGAAGHVSDEPLNLHKKNMLLKAVVKEMDLEKKDGYEKERKTFDEPSARYDQWIFTKGNRKVYISVVSLTGVMSDSYLLIRDVYPYEFDEANKKRAEYKKLYEGLGIEANTNLYMKLCHQGSLSGRNKNEIVKKVFKEVNAKEVAAIRESDLYTIYGYTKNEEEMVDQNGNPVNVNIGFSYDETKDMTYLHIGMPFVNKSY